MTDTTRPGFYECPASVFATCEDDDYSEPFFDCEAADRAADEARDAAHAREEDARDAEYELQICLHDFAMAASKDVPRARKALDAARAEVSKFRKLVNGR